MFSSFAFYQSVSGLVLGFHLSLQLESYVLFWFALTIRSLDTAFGSNTSHRIRDHSLD